MARNRKLRSAAVRFGPAIKALLLCVLIGGSGVGYVWQKEQIINLDRQIKIRENSLATLQKQNRSYGKQLDNMRLHGEIKKRIIDLKLGLSEPQPSQKWRMTEPAGDGIPALESQERPPTPQVAQVERTRR